MAALAVEVIAGVVFRYSGYALVWYDEVATILLAWVTYYGSALAVPRVLAAILEQYRREDGGIDIPLALWPYMRGITTIEPK